MCGLSRELAEMDSSTKTIQFLMGLGEVLDVVKNKILMQELLSNANKAYSMLQNVESQKIVHKNFEEMAESSTMMVKTQGYGRNGNKGGFQKKEGEKKEDQFCDYRKVQCHLKERCFKLNGYPEWYVELLKNIKEKKRGKKQANVTDVAYEENFVVDAKQQSWMIDLIK